MEIYIWVIAGLVFWGVFWGIIIEIYSRLRPQPPLINPTGENIQSDPYPGDYYGNHLGGDHVGVKPVRGVLRIVDDAVVFRAPNVVTDVRIPLNAIQWAGIHAVRISGANKRRSQPWSALAIHYIQSAYLNPDRQQWRAATFAFSHDNQFLARLIELTGLGMGAVQRRKPCPDFGPLSTEWLEQDMLGYWNSLRRGDVYLTPTDLLLFDHDIEHALPLTHLRRIDVIALPGRDNLLRLEYDDVHGERQVVGYPLWNAAELAAVLSDRSGVPYLVEVGRKKKQKN